MLGIEFFPTPANVISKMLQKISPKAKYFLEPSAGKGDIAHYIKTSRFDTVIDCIEIDANLQAILRSKNYTVVGEDFLQYSGVCYYDAIIMNPPFSNGDEHLLHAWNFLNDGEIVCLLNEETLKNLCTKRRQNLFKIIQENGNIEYLGNCFRDSEVATDVNVAMVYLKKQCDDDMLDLLHQTKKEKEIDGTIDEKMDEVALQDKLGNMEHYFNYANEHFSKAFAHIRKAGIYLEANGIAKDGYEHILKLAFENMNVSKAELIKKHRKDAWKSVFAKMEFRRWLDRKQTEDFLQQVEKSEVIPFTKENIKGTLHNIFGDRENLFKKSVATMFDALTLHFHGNTSHTEGWKTNSSYKVNQKLIFPYGVTFSYGSYSIYGSYTSKVDIYNDLDRILCVLNGDNFLECNTIELTLREKFRKDCSDKTAESQFFDIKFFKKGTLHLRFKDERLWKEFNKAASEGKNWIGKD